MPLSKSFTTRPEINFIKQAVFKWFLHQQRDPIFPPTTKTWESGYAHRVVMHTWRDVLGTQFIKRLIRSGFNTKEDANLTGEIFTTKWIVQGAKI